MAGPTQQFWQQRFEAELTPWDRGAASPLLLRWLNDGELRPCRILVPGCGSGYEVQALASAGFDVTALDYAPAAIDRVRARLRDAHLDARLIEVDVLRYRPEQAFDAIYEQTCLCAIYPDSWVNYARQCSSWLRPNGRLYAAFAQVPRASAAEGIIEGPPYHCDINAMRALFGEPAWCWPKPPFARIEHPAGVLSELAVILERAAPHVG